MDQFDLGSDACVAVRVGENVFEVFPRSGGRHVLELLSSVRAPHLFSRSVAYLDGQELFTDGMLGIWDLLDLPLGGLRTFEAEVL